MMAWDDLIFESIILEKPRSLEENIRRGNKALVRVLASQGSEWMAMFRNDYGWIGFEWGYQGDPPPKFETPEEMLEWWDALKNKKALFKKGFGFSHIIAKRNWEGKYIKELFGQKGIDVAKNVPEIIAKGRKVKGDDAIVFNNQRVILKRTLPKYRDVKSDQYWVVSSYEQEKEGYKLIFESAGATRSDEFSCPTHYGPTQSRSIGGASLDDESKEQQICSPCATHSKPTTRRRGMGAELSMILESAGECGCLNVQTPHLRMNSLHFSVYPWEQQIQKQPENKINTFDAWSKSFAWLDNPTV